MHETARRTRDALQELVSGGTISRDAARGVFEELLGGGLDDAQIGALLALLQARGVTADELAGAAEAMRSHVTPVPFEAGPGESLIDTCGTGGARKTFNVSTASAIVAASSVPASGTGVSRVVVAKHGNRSRTGRGSAEVLSALGVNVDASPETQARCLREAGVCFCFAIRHHPAMRHAKGPRASLGFPTIFNLLGPLTNPARADRQLIGVYDGGLAERVAEALALLGARHAIVAAARDGIDELSIGALTDAWIVRDGFVRREAIDPGSLGLVHAAPESLLVDSVEAGADAVRAVLGGERGGRRDIVLLNAAAALVVAGAAGAGEAGVGEAGSLEAGLSIAADAVDSGRAGATLAELVRVSGGD